MVKMTACRRQSLNRISIRTDPETNVKEATELKKGSYSELKVGFFGLGPS